MNCKQFEIWVADLNPQIGTETGKIRPVLIIQTDLLNTVHPSIIICPLTTQVNKKANLLRVHLDKKKFSLKQSSDVMIDQVRAIDKKRLQKKIAVLDPTTVQKIKNNLAIILDL